ncbi:MAG: hypothetical protein Q9224_002473 [Gallowayella concinna]
MPQPPDQSVSSQNRAPVSNSVPESDLIWTQEREERLVYVQGQLATAQKRWSEEQDLWIDEVHHLEELKRHCLKAEKKAMARGRANSVAAIWKTKTWGSSKNKGSLAEGENSPSLGDEVDDAIEEEEPDGEDDADGMEFTSRTKPSSSLFRTISHTSNDHGHHQGRRRNTLDGGQPVYASLSTTPEPSYEDAKTNEKGKARVLHKRRRSGR